MTNKKIMMFCVTDKVLNYHRSLPFKFAGVGMGRFPKNYLLSNQFDNIFFKEKYYSELTFHYWFWKNMLKKIHKNTWIGFCQKRRFWLKKSVIKDKINIRNLKKNILRFSPKEWNNKESVIAETIFVNNVKKIKLIKRGFKSLIRNPGIFFNIKKQSVKLHFDMHHGYGNFEKAINLINNNDRDDFRKFVNTSNSFNPHIMFITRPKIANKWFSDLFPWLFKCEKEFGFANLSGYDTTRIYAYLAERYLSFWFKKYTKFIEWPIITFNK